MITNVLGIILCLIYVYMLIPGLVVFRILQSDAVKPDREIEIEIERESTNLVFPVYLIIIFNND